VTAAGGCAVHWAPVDARLADASVLSGDEHARAARYRREVDRTRFVLAASLLRRVVAEATGAAPEEVDVDRRCPTCGEPHGRPVLPGLDLHASITHSGEVVGVALTRAGPVGLDVQEFRADDVPRVASAVLGDGERARTPEDFYRYWTRKEALVKATGDGIGIGLEEVLVGPPAGPPRLVRYPGRPGLAVQMADLAPRPRHGASVAVLTGDPVEVTERWHRAVIPPRSARPRS
jgi:4'-phosphopantetheinyl transferase